MRIAANPPLWAKHFCYLQKCWCENFLWISEGGEMKTRGKKVALHHSFRLWREELNFIRMSAVYWLTPVSEIPADCFSDFSSRAEMSVITIVALLVFLTIPEGESNHKCAFCFLLFVAACSLQTLCDLQSAVRLTGYPSPTLTTSGISLGDQGVVLRCQCITKERKPIGRHIGQVEVNPVSSHCNAIEIM